MLERGSIFLQNFKDFFLFLHTYTKRRVFLVFFGISHVLKIGMPNKILFFLSKHGRGVPLMQFVVSTKIGPEQ